MIPIKLVEVYSGPEAYVMSFRREAAFVLAESSVSQVALAQAYCDQCNAFTWPVEFPEHHSGAWLPVMSFHRADSGDIRYALLGWYEVETPAESVALTEGLANAASPS
jgi:hypothetical protein